MVGVNCWAIDSCIGYYKINKLVISFYRIGGNLSLRTSKIDPVVLFSHNCGVIFFFVLSLANLFWPLYTDVFDIRGAIRISKLYMLSTFYNGVANYSYLPKITSIKHLTFTVFG